MILWRKCLVRGAREVRWRRGGLDGPSFTFALSRYSLAWHPGNLIRGCMMRHYQLVSQCQHWEILAEDHQLIICNCKLFLPTDNIRKHCLQGNTGLCHWEKIVSSDRSSCTDDGLLYIRAARQLFQIFTQSLDAIDVMTQCQILSYHSQEGQKFKTNKYGF